MSVLNFSYNFNPRSYKRSDISIISVDIYPQISIHAPTRGATRKIVRGYYTIQFQSTLLQEERRSAKKELTEVCDFNPRSYKRSDGLFLRKN